MISPAVRSAGLDDVDALAPLFDAYRRFYDQPADLALARTFLHDRLARGESILLMAEDAGGPLGFCQLYPGWCSVAAARILVLYDLFVAPAARRGGTGRALMRAAREAGRAAGAARLELSTAHDNAAAQALYESEGWRRDEVFRVYALPLDGG